MSATPRNVSLFLSCLLASFAGLLTTSCSSPEPTRLKDAYADHFLIGSALKSSHIFGTDVKGQALVAEQFNAVTAENDMKWENMQPSLGEFNFSAADALVAFSEKNDLFVVGHTLLWHQQTPSWVFEDEDGQQVTREVLLERLKNHIQTVMGHYKGRIQGWDVVNEAIEEDGSLRQSKWLEIIGPDYVELALRYAQEADPDAELYYNDFNVSKPAKLEGIVKLLKDLQSKGVKVDGVGIQGHYGLGYPKLSDLEASIVAINELGLPVMFTELDVSVLPFPSEEAMGADVSLSFELQDKLNPYAEGLPADVSQRQADSYAALFELFLRHSEGISRVTFWGVDDGSSWKNHWPVPGRTDYPLLFDREFQPKQAFHAIMDLVD